jgi:hypothetical protein
VKTISKPNDKKEVVYAKAQEACRKDIEIPFGVLQARFAIVRGPAHFWDMKSLQFIMKACVILHNIIIEDERGKNLEFLFDTVSSRFRQEKSRPDQNFPPD